MRTEERAFIQRAEAIADDQVHAQKLGKAIRNHAIAVDGMIRQQFSDWPAMRAQAASVKDYVIDHWPELLEQFEERITERGAVVLWADNDAEAREHIHFIASRHAAKRIVKSKTMISEEIELNDYLEKLDIEVIESDLGELIVQLGREKPYHIVTPAMHKSKAEISKLFVEKLGIEPTDDAAELTMAARQHLRRFYVSADIGITGANFLIADEGAIAMTENEGNGRLTMGCPPVHVVLAGIEKLVPRMEDLALFWPLLSTSGTGQQLTSYNTVVRGPKQPEETDGPEAMYVILIDNGRSRLYADPRMREALRCIRCGSCLNACPIFKTIGGHAYGTTYQGPIGSVITPHLQPMEKWAHLPQASSLCGACTSVCPVNIDLHGLLLENRWQARQRELSGTFWGVALRGWSFAMQRRWRMEWGRRCCRWFGRLLPMPRGVRQGLPSFAPKSFAEQWQDEQKARNGETQP